MEVEGSWRELHRCRELEEAGAIATSIAAMEYDVRIVDEAGRAVEGLADLVGPFLIEVRDRDWSDLTDVLDQVIEEQGEFDATLEARDRRASRARRLALWVLIGTVIALALLGLADL